MTSGDKTEKHELQGAIESLYDKYKPLAEGDLATYIPELGRANPEDFGICIQRFWNGHACVQAKPAKMSPQLLAKTRP